MSTLYVMVGIPASGKSTKTKELADKGAVIISSDRIREEIFGDQDVQYTDDWLREHGYDGPDDILSKKAFANNIIFDLVFKRCSEYLSRGFDVVTDSTSCSRAVRKRVLESIKNASKRICIVMAVPFAECIRRNALRNRDVPEHVMKRIADHFQFPSLAEGFDEIMCIGNREDIDYGEAKNN